MWDSVLSNFFMTIIDHIFTGASLYHSLILNLSGNERHDKTRISLAKTYTKYC